MPDVRPSMSRSELKLLKNEGELERIDSGEW